MAHLSQSHGCVKASNRLNGTQRLLLGHNLVGRVQATGDENRSEKALSALESLLGSESELDSRDPNLVEWWSIRPRQTAPPRTTSISSAASSAGRFIANEEMMRNEVWAGRKTLPGQSLELPKVAPYESYAIALVHAAVYGTVVRVQLTQGADAAGDLLGALGLSGTAVIHQTELWRFLSGCFVHPDLASLAVVLYGMMVVAPRVEACLGYHTFTATYVLSAIAAGDILLALSSTGATAEGITVAGVQAVTKAAAAVVSNDLLEAVLMPGSQVLGAGEPGLLCGGLGAVMGLAGSAVAHQLINGDVEWQASCDAASSSSVSSSEGTGAERNRTAATGGQVAWGTVVDARTGLLVAGATALALRHASEPGGVALVAALCAGFGAGFLLAYIAGPRYQVTREVELPDGTMWIPDAEAMTEMTVVLDQTPSIQRTLATMAVATVLSAITLGVVFRSGL